MEDEAPSTVSRVLSWLYPAPAPPPIPNLAVQPPLDSEWTRQRMRADCLSYTAV